MPNLNILNTDFYLFWIRSFFGQKPEKTSKSTEFPMYLSIFAWLDWIRFFIKVSIDRFSMTSYCNCVRFFVLRKNQLSSFYYVCGIADFYVAPKWF